MTHTQQETQWTRQEDGQYIGVSFAMWDMPCSSESLSAFSAFVKAGDDAMLQNTGGTEEGFDAVVPILLASGRPDAIRLSSIHDVAKLAYRIAWEMNQSSNLSEESSLLGMLPVLVECIGILSQYAGADIQTTG